MLIYEKKSIFRFAFSVISYQPYFSYSSFFIFLILFHITLYSSRIKKEKHHDLNATVFPFPYYTISLLLYFTSYFPDSFKRTIALAREALET